MSPMQFVLRKSDDRGHADHGWLQSFHTFSFATYHDNKNELFGPLRVINEDRVAAHTGFGSQYHREFEIFSYLVSGELEHKDSMGNIEILSRGTLQLTSSGTGVSHSERAHGTSPVHLLQIWSLPHTPRLSPRYYTRQFSDADKCDKFVKLVAPSEEDGVSSKRDGEGPAPVHSALTMYAGMIGTGVKSQVQMKGSKGYVLVVQTSGYWVGTSQGAMVRVRHVMGDMNEMVLSEGDGSYVLVGERGNMLGVENIGDGIAEVLVFDLE